MPKKNIKKLESLTTPGHMMQVRSWIAELMMVRYHKGQLPPYFWRDGRWKWRYANEMKAVTKFIKKYGEGVVLKVICDAKINSFASYAELEFHLQREFEAQARLALPKDTTEVVNEVRDVSTDLREPRSVVSKRGLFDRLAELENG